jgi:hypothetical protein
MSKIAVFMNHRKLIILNLLIDSCDLDLLFSFLETQDKTGIPSQLRITTMTEGPKSEAFW